jgi:hypothetical protein
MLAGLRPSRAVPAHLAFDGTGHINHRMRQTSGKKIHQVAKNDWCIDYCSKAHPEVGSDAIPRG